MLKRLALLGFVLASSPAFAQNCANYPNDLTNGTVADANQVMQNFNSILSCANSQLAHNGVNSDITQLLSVTNLAFAPVNNNITSINGLTTPLAITEGGTGANNASGARTNLGLGTAAIENLVGAGTGGNVIDNGVAAPNNSLVLSNSGVTAGTYTAPTFTVTAQGIITSATSGTAAGIPATASQMNTGTDNTDYATPNNLQYSQNAVRAWASWSCAPSTCTIGSSYNVNTIHYNSAGNYTITLSGGLSFSSGAVICSATTGGGAGSSGSCGPSSTALTGTNPAVTVIIRSAAGSVTDCDIACSAIIVGNAT